MNSLVRSACRIPISRFSTAQCNRGWVRKHEVFKELQKPFLVDDGVPMYLKKGSRDRIVFVFICAYTALVFAYSMKYAYEIVYPPKTD